MRRLAVVVLLLVLAATPSAHGVVGGSAVDIRDAPWNVLVLHRVGASGSLCTGSILDPLHVLTAAHCVVENGAAYPASTLSVRAGLTNALSPSATDARQDADVASVRIHRGYVDGDRTGADDVAVLILATPLDHSGPTAQPIALPTPGVALEAGDDVSLAGYGVKAAGASADGTLNGMSGTLIDSGRCLPRSDEGANGVLLCVFSGPSSPCSGDSGGALVVRTPAPVLVGVTRAATIGCRANTGSSYANVTAPEILEFVRGNDSPPMGPRPTGSTMLEGPTTVMQVGQTVTCRAGSWSGNPTFAYELWEDENDTVLRRGPSPDFELREEDAGRTLYCRVLATNAGGTTFDESPDAGVPVQSPPELSVSPSTAQRGRSAALRVRLDDWTRPLGNVAVCVRFAPRVGGKVCRTAAPAGAAPVVVMKLRVKPTAPLVRARATVTARAADGRAAIGPAFVQLR